MKIYFKVLRPLNFLNNAYRPGTTENKFQQYPTSSLDFGLIITKNLPILAEFINKKKSAQSPATMSLNFSMYRALQHGFQFEWRIIKMCYNFVAKSLLLRVWEKSRIHLIGREMHLLDISIKVAKTAFWMTIQ